jgi:hypothetical protein
MRSVVESRVVGRLLLGAVALCGIATSLNMVGVETGGASISRAAASDTVAASGKSVVLESGKVTKLNRRNHTFDVKGEISSGQIKSYNVEYGSSTRFLSGDDKPTSVARLKNGENVSGDGVAYGSILKMYLIGIN